MVYRTEVEEWLLSIGLPELYRFFVEDGFTSIDSVKRMRQSDIDAIVDRNGYMIILNDEIDRLNYGDSSSYGYGVPVASPINDYRAPSAHRASSVYLDAEPSDYETRESLISRYETGGVPAVGFASRHFARRAKSKARTARGGSMAPLSNSRASQDRYIPNSASNAYENLFAAKRAISVAATTARELEHAAASAALEDRQRRRDDQRQQRARTEMHYTSSAPSDGASSDNLDRGKFRDHYTNEYVWVEKNHVNDVGCKYDGLSRKVDHKPSHWRCEDEIERGREYKRMNDECADKIADNRYSIAQSREWITDDGGLSDQLHRMSAKTQKTRYDLDSIKRNMDNLKSMRTRLLKN